MLLSDTLVRDDDHGRRMTIDKSAFKKLRCHSIFGWRSKEDIINEMHHIIEVIIYAITQRYGKTNIIILFFI